MGRVYITLKRHASELDELTEAEDLAFITHRNNVIRALRKTFNPITFNISCLKNDAFKSDPNNTPSSAAHVHWHIIPRYDALPHSFAGETFYDPSPGHYLSSDRERRVLSDEQNSQISAAIASNYHQN